MDIVNEVLSTFGLPEDVYNILVKVIRILIICIIALILIKLSNKNSKLIKKFGNKYNRDNTKGLFISRMISVIILIITIFLILTELGYNVNALLTSLGIGGVIIALAAQDVAKNFFGGVTIITDKPFKVGDLIEIGNMEGYVEDITIRSTRVRCLDGSLIIVPNSTISNENLITWGNSKYRRYKFFIYFTLDTKLDKIDKFISKAYNIIENTPNVIDKMTHISFNEIKDSGFEIEFMVDTKIVAKRPYLKFKELINYKVMALVEQEKIELAYPTQTIHVRGDNA